MLPEGVVWGKRLTPAIATEIIERVRAAGAAPVVQPPVPPEPDMRHPKIQRLIGQKARREIELSLVEELLDDGPDVEVSAMSMEYWGPMHDKLKAALSKPHVPVPTGWQLVPVEPTPDMVRAGWLAQLPSEQREPWDAGATKARAIYTAMLPAAPQQAPAAKEQP